MDLTYCGPGINPQLLGIQFIINNGHPMGKLIKKTIKASDCINLMKNIRLLENYNFYTFVK